MLIDDWSPQLPRRRHAGLRCAPLAARRPNGMTFERPARRKRSALMLPVHSLTGHGTLPLKGEAPVALSNAMLKG